MFRLSGGAGGVWAAAFGSGDDGGEAGDGGGTGGGVCIIELFYFMFFVL